MVQSLLERELRRAMDLAKLPSIPLYPEGRPCTRPTTRRLLDDFAPLSRHTLTLVQSLKQRMWQANSNGLPQHDPAYRGGSLVEVIGGIRLFEFAVR